MVLPLMKLGTLLVKTVSKPLASQLKHQAKVHPQFRQFIINFAQVILCNPLFLLLQLSSDLDFLKKHSSCFSNLIVSH